MSLTHSYQYTPIGSISLLPEEDRIQHIKLFHSTPPKISSVLSSPATGTYIRGFSKPYNIAVEECPKIAQAMFFVITGAKPMLELPAILSESLAISIDTAQKIANEIQHDILKPMQIELDQFLIKQQEIPLSDSSRMRKLPNQERPQNILNLKEISAKLPEKELIPPKQRASLTAPTSNPAKQTPLPPEPIARQFPLPPKLPN